MLVKTETRVFLIHIHHEQEIWCEFHGLTEGHSYYAVDTTKAKLVARLKRFRFIHEAY